MVCGAYGASFVGPGAGRPKAAGTAAEPADAGEAAGFGASWALAAKMVSNTQGVIEGRFIEADVGALALRGKRLFQRFLDTTAS